MRPVLFVGLALAIAPLLAPAQTDEPLPPARYSVRSEDPPTGSHLQRTVVSGLRVPLNRTYAQLTAAEKQRVASQYEVMRAGDEPPYPVDGLFPLYRDAQKAIARSHETGTLSLVANVDAAGVVTSVQLLGDAEPNLASRTASLLYLTRFKPAMCAGVPCAMGFPLRLNVKRVL